MTRRFLGSWLVGLLLVTGCGEQASMTITKGVKLPKFQVESYLNKEPPSFENKLLVIDFFATWCRPCVAAIPHMNQIHQKYKNDLVVVGLTSESPSVVRQFGLERFDYYIASDSQDRQARFLKVSGIPHIAVVDADRYLLWEGHPRSLSDAMIDTMITHTKKSITE